jgi:hypothetical protein
METPNQTQIAGQLRTALAAGGPIAAFALSKTGWSQADYAMYMEMALYILPPLIAAVWSYVAKRDGNLIKAASKVEGATVVVDATASAAVQAVAKHDNTAPDVVTTKAFLEKETASS